MSTNLKEDQVKRSNSQGVAWRDPNTNHQYGGTLPSAGTLMVH